MSHDPFTLDMFGSSAPSSGLGLGIAAFDAIAPVGAANDDEPDPTPPAPAAGLTAVPSAVPRSRLPPSLHGRRLFAFADELLDKKRRLLEIEYVLGADMDAETNAVAA